MSDRSQGSRSITRLFAKADKCVTGQAEGVWARPRTKTDLGDTPVVALCPQVFVAGGRWKRRAHEE